ncbi:uncharacterized protein LOC117140690 isoform X1 [Drosophila mauritiana]|uniref:Uncharacterized protein LOC117140690 isoform X1 n=1 Tax=Drosophila mauritiana TaxID=7226 RepID=A0A6P8K954_DROMA|nr:uncharacterized protein LOC117140690 isoform X1 [Drosophila mauritiana]XP_033159641.1 uncharacterized protein LOC117140690 isoform X1 [Drosophila mauritiana]
MPFLRKLVRQEFCFCISLTSGCIIVAFYTLFFGFINAGTTVDEVIYKDTLKTDVYAKWFNVFHIALMIAAAVILLVSIMTKYLRIVFVWMAMFIVHMISYYIVFNALINVRNPFFKSAVYAIIYVFVNLVTLGIDLFCVLKVYTYYYVKTHPDEFRPVCVDK